MIHKNRTFAGLVVMTVFALILAACSPASVTPAAPQVTAPLPNTGVTSSPSSSSQTVAVTLKQNKDLGSILADSKGKTLYIYTKDTPNTSNCYDKCAAAWPALTVAQGVTPSAGPGINAQFGTTQRKDGSLQVTVNGMPVYYWFKDATNDDATGQGVGSVWYVLDASGNIVKTPLPVTPTAPATAAPTAVATSAPAASSSIINSADNPGLGKILVDSKGMTLYIFTKDALNTSNCYDQCAQNWPPVIVSQAENLSAGSGINVQLGTAARKDGSLQLTVNGMPVYYWFKDAKPGDATGQNVGSVWFVLDPSGAIIKTVPSASNDIIEVEDSALGKILTDNKGMSLYIFTSDTPNTSNCYDQCAKNWPPLTVPQGTELEASGSFTGQLGTTQRKDGSLQVTVNGMPVYYFFKDVKAGDTTGQGVGSVWFVLDSSGNMIQAEAPTATPVSSAYDSYNASNP